MSRKARCRNCGEWYYNHNGQYIVLPDTYDDSMCGNCNRSIDAEIAENQTSISKDYKKLFS